MDGYLYIYTDGSHKSSPRRGGVGVRFVFPNGEIKNFKYYGYKGATINKMELQAPILALKEVLKIDNLREFNGIIVYTDSQYIVSNYGNAMFLWSGNGWIKNNGEPVANVEQWKELLRLMKKIKTKGFINVNFKKVKAHSGDEHNEAVDRLSKESREGLLKEPLSNVIVRRKNTNKQTARGSVIGEGQKLRIRIVNVEWMKSHKVYKYRFEVLSKKSKYFNQMDFVYFEKNMRVGHIFDVRLMKGLSYCRIKKIIKKIK